MKRNVLKFMGLFMTGLVVMHGVFAAGEQAKAAHAASGTYSYAYGTDVIVEAGTNKLSPCYCIESSVWISTGDNGASDRRTLDARQSLIINTAMLFGFNTDNLNTELTNDQFWLRSHTQSYIWEFLGGRVTGEIDNATESGIYGRLQKQVAYHVADPSYITDAENELTWNEQTNQFELVLTNTVTDGTYSANALVKADATTLPNGVQVVAEGETLKITSTEEFTTAQTIKLYKRVQEKGQLVIWDFGNRQDQVTLDYDEASIAKTMDLKIKTGTKPVAATPEPTPEPSVDPIQPTAPAPAPEVNQEPVVEDQTAQVQDGQLQEVAPEQLQEQLDDVPKTADSSNLQLVFKLMGASAFAMIAMVAINVVNKKRRYS